MPKTRKGNDISGIIPEKTGRVVGTLIGLAEAGEKFPGSTSLLSVRDLRLQQKAKGGVKKQERR